MSDFVTHLPIAFRIEWRRFWREPLFYFLAFSRPVIWLLLLSGGLMFSSRDRTDLLVALLTYCCVFTGITSAFSLTWERDRGLLKLWNGYRLPKSSYVLGKLTFAVVLIGLITTTSIAACSPFVQIEMSLLMGLQPLSAFLLHAALTSSFGLAIASLVTRLDLFGAIINVILFPMLFTSGAMYPLGDSGGLVAAVASVNPLRLSVDHLSGTLTDQEFGHEYRWMVVLICVVIFTAIAIIALRRET